MSDKYIIRNCPAFVLMRTATSGTYFNMCGNAKGHIKCADCTDCVMKQIVELCKENLNSLETYVDVRSFECVVLQNILQLLDIQEVK